MRQEEAFSEKELLVALQSTFGFPEFRGQQLQAVQAALAGRDAVVLMPTGGGKSLCYALPAVVLGKLTVVVSPLIALMEDQVGQFRARGVAADFLSSSRTEAEREAVFRELMRGATTLRLLYVTPEALELSRGLLTTLQGLYARGRLGLLAIDEAHCISEWGHDFRPAYRKLARLRHELPRLPVLALTATARPQVREDIVTSLALRAPLRLVGSFDRPNIRYAVGYCLQHNRHPIEQICGALAELQGDTKDPVCAIVYTLKKEETEEAAAQLRARGYEAQAYHGGMSKADRSAVLNDWLHGVFGIVCATVAFGMGIDKADVRLVAHLNLPKSLEGYYQESGRAGRDGLPARSLLFYSRQDRDRMEFILGKGDKRKKKRKRGKGDAEKRALEAFQAVVGFCTAERCRRSMLLGHFGERLPEGSDRGKGCCDYCQDPGRVHTQLEEMQKETLFQHGFRAQRSGTQRGSQGAGGSSGDGSEEEGSEAEGISDSDGEREAAAAAAVAAKRARGGAPGGPPGGKRAGGAAGVVAALEAAEETHAAQRSARGSSRLHALVSGSGGAGGSGGGRARGRAAAAGTAARPQGVPEGTRALAREHLLTALLQHEALRPGPPGGGGGGLLALCRPQQLVSLAQAREEGCFAASAGSKAAYHAKVVAAKGSLAQSSPSSLQTALLNGVPLMSLRRPTTAQELEALCAACEQAAAALSAGPAPAPQPAAVSKALCGLEALKQVVVTPELLKGGVAARRVKAVRRACKQELVEGMCNGVLEAWKQDILLGQEERP